MATLSADVSATQKWLPLSEVAALALAPGFYTIGSENVKVTGISYAAPAEDDTGPHGQPLSRVRGVIATRGVGGSTAASHSAGATVTAYYPDAPGGEGGPGGGIPNPFIEDVDAGGQRITNLAAPGADNDPIRVADLDAVINNLSLAAVLDIDNDANGSNITNLTSLSGTVGNPLGIESDIDMDGNKITGLSDPADPQDAATQQYVDNLGEGLVVLAGNSGMRRVTIDLDAAEIATLSSVPVEVVAAPGAGKVIVPVAASFQYKAGAVGFTNDQPVNVGLPGASGLLLGGTIPFSGTTDAVGTFAQQAQNPDLPDIENQPLTLIADELDPDGAGDGTARLTVLYYVMNLI